MPADLLRLFSGTAAAFIALLMMRAALHKVADEGRFEGLIADYRLAPEWALKSLRVLLPALEIAAAGALCLAPSQPAGAALAAGLLLTYGAAMALALARGETEIDCGCGGPALPLGWSLVARNVILSAALIPAALGGGGWRTLGEAGAGWAVAVVGLACWAAGEQLAANHHRMRQAAGPSAAQMFGGAA